MKASKHVWLTALAGVGPRSVAALALVAAFAVVAPNEGRLDTGQEPGVPGQGTLEKPLGIAGSVGGVHDLTTADSMKLASEAEELSIPPVALAAYQRSSAVLNDADAACRIDWALIAAIGMVESNHGRHGGSELGPDGAASPAIIGAPLDGKDGRAEIRDTDNGLYDHDTVYDRAVGPMQFIPSTWTYAGADGDGDNRRNPQDIDDAAVAGAAYLCAGSEDVSTDAGARSAVFRYNQSETYVDTVLKIADSYRNGKFPGAAIVDRGSPSTLKPTVSALPPKAVRPEKPATPEPSAAPKAAAAPAAPEATVKASEKPEPAASADPSAGAKGEGDGEAEESNTLTPTPTPTPTPAPTADPPATETPEPEPVVKDECKEAVIDTFFTPSETGPTLTPTLSTETAGPESEPQDQVVDLCVEQFKDAEPHPTAEEIINDYLKAESLDAELAKLLVELGLPATE